MTWTAPKTDWSTGELITADDMNAIGENLASLRGVSTAESYTTTADISISSNIPEFIDIDSDNLNLSLTTSGGDVLVHFDGTLNVGDAQFVYLDVEVDGTRLGGANGILSHQMVRVSGVAYADNIVSFTRLIQNLSAGSHTFKFQWKSSFRFSMRAGAHYWVREL
ncbi:MAG: hypothetical protein OXG39_12645 [Chloroflexi bacterium]|nr:hypothetical protein [Chloroflexota bacterium]